MKLFSKYEGKTYTKLYGLSRGRGVRHGLTAGGVIGSFINQDDLSAPDAPLSQNGKSKASKSYKTRFRQFRYSNRRKCVCGKSNKYNRHSYSRRY